MEDFCDLRALNMYGILEEVGPRPTIFYHTSHHQHSMKENLIIGFQLCSKECHKEKHVARRELVKDGIGGRLSMVQREPY